MSFWNALEAQPQNEKSSYVIVKDLVNLLDKEKDIGTTGFKQIRFLGSFFGVNTINVPLLTNNNQFVRKNNRLVSIPKISLGYDYLTGKLDESKCPYLQYATLDSSALTQAVISYITESTIKDKELLLQSINAYGLRRTWNDKTCNTIIKTSRELTDQLKSVAECGVKDFYCNVIVYPIKPDFDRVYADFNMRTEGEKTPVNFLTYSTTYGEQVYLKDADRQAPSQTPAKVIKLSSNALAGLFKDVVKLNTLDPNDPTTELKGIEDPTFGCRVNVRLEPLPNLKAPDGKLVCKYVFSRGDRTPLTDNEKKYLLWDLTKLQGTETHEQAITFLQKQGYINTGASMNTNNIQTSNNLSFNASIANIANVVTPTAPSAPIANVVTPEVTPVVINNPVAPVVNPAPQVQAPITSAAEFDNMFNS